MIKSHRFPAVSSLPARIIFTAALSIAGLSALLAAGGALADATRPIVNEKFSDFAPAIAELT